MDATAAFERYEELRPRLPQAQYPQETQRIDSLLDIADQGDAFVFDAFGVLNVGGTPIEGARARIDQLRELGKKVFILTNSASYDRPQTAEKFADLGFEFSDEEIISSRYAGMEAIAAHSHVTVWGVISAPHHNPETFPYPQVLLENDPADYAKVDGFVFLSTGMWNVERQALLHAAMQANPRPLIVANPDLVSPNEQGLNLEPGLYSNALQDALGITPEFHGKPYPSVYKLVQALLPENQDPARIIMMGDTLHTDVLGACAHGWRTVLVTDHGLFAGRDVTPFITTSGIVPHWQLGSI